MIKSKSKKREQRKVARIARGNLTQTHPKPSGSHQKASFVRTTRILKEVREAARAEKRARKIDAKLQERTQTTTPTGNYEQEPTSIA